jgi:hypothetical protein
MEFYPGPPGWSSTGVRLRLGPRHPKLPLKMQESPLRVVPHRPPLTSDDVMNFLGRNFPDRFCAACITLKIGGGLVQTLECLKGLREMRVVLCRTEECQSCGQTLEVFGRRVILRRRPS